MSEPIETKVLQIPVGDSVTLIPFPMSEEDFDMMLATLDLWKKRIVHNKSETFAKRTALDEKTT